MLLLKSWILIFAVVGPREIPSAKTPEVTPNVVLMPKKTKWQNKNYLRTERNRRTLHNSLLIDQLKQPLITNFYPILNKIEKIIIENQNLK